MKNHILILFLFITSNYAFAQSDEPQIKKSASKINDFIPANWRLLKEVKGDLNKDGLADVALIIENTDPKNLINNKGNLGTDTLNINPRTLMVLLRQANGKYLLTAKNTNFVPSENDEESTCLADPISETGGVDIKKGVLIVSFQYWLSCGSYSVNTNNYTFRFQNQKFQLIGYDEHFYSRSSGEITKTSVNFSTNRISYTEGGNMFDDNENKPKTRFKKMPAKQLFDLSSIKEDDMNIFNR